MLVGVAVSHFVVKTTSLFHTRFESWAATVLVTLALWVPMLLVANWIDETMLVAADRHQGKRR